MFPYFIDLHLFLGNNKVCILAHYVTKVIFQTKSAPGCVMFDFHEDTVFDKQQ